jgi:Flp pilus assembly protein TadG
LVLPILLAILAAVADLGGAFHTYITMVNAAREGARYGTEEPWDTSGIRARVLTEASSSDVDLSGATITVDTQGSGTPICVTVGLEYSPVLLGSLLGISPLALEASATFLVR